MSRQTINNNIEAFYGLTPMQKGLLYHNLYDKNTREYILQIQMKVGTKLSENFTEKALHLALPKKQQFLYKLSEKNSRLIICLKIMLTKISIK